MADSQTSDPPTTTSELRTEGAVAKGEYWLDDGNIVLIAQGTVAFRVYKGLLARASPVFKDLFAIDAVQVGEMMDGVPVVTVTDYPEALRRFLMFLLEPSYE